MRVLFLCTGNSCRSQMAEGLLRHMAQGKVEVFSAGTHPAGYVHPLAIEVMREIGIDISHQRSKNVSEFLGQAFDYVITVCDGARETCPYFPGQGTTLHQSFEDPAQAVGTHEEKMHAFRKVRDELSSFLQNFLAL
ncbi:MAG: arsenate reductase ArsC [Bacteroidia bacterium]